MNADDVLDDEFVRAKPPGIRLVSVGILKLALKLDLSILKRRETDDTTPGDDMEWAALCFLMDERNSLEGIRQATVFGREFLLSSRLDQYQFEELTPQFLIRVKAEVDRTNRAVAAATRYTVESPPGGREGPQPAGK